jgi:tRNA(fMet)-specific endonuclease VapC
VTLLLVDTTFLVDAERRDADLDALIADDDDVAISAITVAELLVGVGLAAGAHRALRQTFVDDVVDTLPVLGYDVHVAEAHAQLLIAARQSGRPRGAHDLIIAATARASHRVVVTADPAGFKNLPGVAVLPHR